MTAPSRRRFLQLGLLGGAGLAVAGLAARVTGGYQLAPGEVPIGLDVRGMHVVRALCEALLPEEDGMPSAVALGVPQRIDEEVWSSERWLAEDLRSAITLVELAPLWKGGGARLTRLSPEARLAAFERLLRGSSNLVANAASALRQMIYLYYYADSRVWPAIGYEGPFVQTPRPPASSLAYQAVRAARRRA